MAVSGGVTSAYRCQVRDGRLETQHAPRLRSECNTIDEAVPHLERGEVVVIAGSDMGKLRTKLASYGIG